MDIREALQDLFGNTQTPESFNALWERIRARTDHSVEMIVSPTPGLDRRLNCYAVALGLHTVPSYLRALRSYPDLPSKLTGEVIEQLVNLKWLVEIQERPAPVGSIILYRRDGKVQHCGIVIPEGRVLSKIQLYEYFTHLPDEIQTSIGLPTQYFAPPDEATKERIAATLIQWAEDDS